MPRTQSRVWRALFVGGGLLFFVGAFFHPRGVTMSDMLVDSAWIPSHATVFVGLLLMTLGLIAFRRTGSQSKKVDRWLFFTILFAVLELVEMALHTLAFVNAADLAHGELHGGWSTPVLTIHIYFAIIIYTPFGVALTGLIWAAQRERSHGSPWIGWLGIVGAAAHALVMWLAIVFQVPGAGILFPIAALATSLWFVLAGVWPAKSSLGAAGEHTILEAVRVR